MKTVISGKLAKTPELKTIETSDGRTATVANFLLFAYDPSAPMKEGTAYKKGIPLSCTAWDVNAEYVAKLQPGDTLTASSTMRYSEYTKKDGTAVVEPNFVIKRIDSHNEIQKQMSALLTGYEEGNIDQLASMQQEQPDFPSPGQNKDQSMDKAAPEKGEENAMELANQLIQEMQSREEEDATPGAEKE